MRELHRAWLMIGGLLKSYRPQTTACDQCGKSFKAQRPKLHKLVKEFGKDEGRRIWKQSLCEGRGIPVESYVGDRRLVHVVCSESCLSMARQSNRETEECLLMIREGRLQIRAIQKFLRTGRLEALHSLPQELGPMSSSQAS